MVEGEEGRGRQEANEEHNVEAAQQPEGVRGTVAKPMTSGENSGYRLISDLCGALVNLVVGLAWPGTVLLLVYLLAQHASGILDSINIFMQNKKSFEVSAGPKEGLIVRIIAREVQNGLSQQVTTQVGSVHPDAKNLQQVAASAATKLVPQALNRPETIVKVLWVDDHPQNNIGLQYAFQALGIVVICIDSNEGIPEAFATSGGFDVVITDMYRDAMRDRPADSQAGLQTVSIIRSQHPRVPVIIYAGLYSAAHANEPVSPPVIVDTNDTQRVFKIVADIAINKSKN
jgi:CheY-like chemotaxis protein